MNRQIKFRAWDNDDKEMLSWDDLSRVNTVWFNDLMRGLRGDMVLMQWTGLLDKNGVEIYCGDIISFPSGLSSQIQVEHEGEMLTAYKSKPNNVGVVLWFKCGFVVHQCGDIKTITNTGHYGSLGSTRNINYSFELEVVGNIHESPELLEQQ